MHILNVSIMIWSSLRTGVAEYKYYSLQTFTSNLNIEITYYELHGFLEYTSSSFVHFDHSNQIKITYSIKTQ